MEPDGQMVTNDGLWKKKEMNLMDLTQNDEPLDTDAPILLKR